MNENRRFFQPSATNDFDPGNFGSQQPLEQQQYHSPFSVYTNGYSSLEGPAMGSGGITPQGASTPPRCAPSSSIQQFAQDSASPVKSFCPVGGSPNFVPNGRASYASATAQQKFDPFGYRSSNNNNYLSGPQQRFSGSNPTAPRPFFDDQQIRPGGGFPPRPAHPQANFLPGSGFRQQQHFPAHQQGNRHPPPPHFFSPPLGPAGCGLMNGANSFGTPNDGFMFNNRGMNGGGGTVPNGHMTTMNGSGGDVGIEFGEDFTAGGMGVTMPAQYVLSDELLDKIQNSQKKQVLFELQIGLEQVAFDTSNNFDTWTMVIKERMIGYGDPLGDMDLNIAAAILVEMAVVLEDCQYNYSRLCQYLCRNIDKFAENVLLPQVASFIQETNTFLNVPHLRNLVLFLAELYDKLDVKGVKSSELAAHLFDQLRNLLKITPLTDPTANAIVKVLKLVGRFLENDRGPQAMGEFVMEFDELVRNTQQLSESVKEKAASLVKLRDNKWGVVAESSANGLPIGVGIIGPDGEPLLTEDECAFLDESDVFGNSPSGSSQMNSPQKVYNNLLEEDQVEDDYEQFLQATAIRAAEKALEKVSIDDDDVESVSSPKFMASNAKQE